MPKFRVHMSNGKSIEIEAKSKQDAAVLAKRSGAFREGFEGFANPFAGIADMMAPTAANMMVPGLGVALQAMNRMPKASPLVDRLSVASNDNQTPAFATGRGVGGAVIGAGALAATGGAAALTAPLLGSTALGAMAGSHAEAGMRRSGAGSGMSLGAGLATDLATSALSRNPMGAVNAVRNITTHLMNPGARLARAMNLGVEGAEHARTASEAVRKSLHDTATALYARVPDRGGVGRLVRSAAMEEAERLMEVNHSSVLSKVVRDVAGWRKLVTKSADTEIASAVLDASGKKIVTAIPGNATGVSFGDIRRAVGGVNRILNHARLAPEFKDAAAVAAKLYGPLHDDLAELALKSPDDAASVKALQDAIEGWGKFREAFPSGSLLEKNVHSATRAIDDPHAAVQSLMVGRNSQRESALLYNSLAGDEPAKRGVARALAERVLMDKGVERHPRAALRELRAMKDVAPHWFGQRGYAAFEHHLRRASPKKFGVTTVLGGGTIGGLLGSMMGGVGYGIGFVVGSGLDVARRYLSADRFHKIALDAVYDPKVQEMLTRRVTDDAEFVRELTDVLARNGIYEVAQNAQPQGEPQ